MNLALFAILVALPVIATAVLFYVFPSTMASILRYRLWPVRDELEDAIRHDEFEDPHQATLLQRDVELSIESANELRPLNMLVLLTLARGRRAPGEWEPFDISKATEADAERLRRLKRRFLSAIIKHIILGSWSGLILGLPLVVAAAFIVLTRDRPASNDHNDQNARLVDEVKESLREDIKVEPTLRVLAGRPTSRKMSAWV